MRYVRSMLAGVVTAAGLAVLTSAPAAGQGTITDGTVSLSYTNVAGGATSTGSFVVAGSDHLFQNWWWLRFSGDPAETDLPTPSNQNYTGNTATLTWLGLGPSAQFDATLVVTLTDNGNDSATASEVLTITHNPPPAVQEGLGNLVQVFGYADFDLANSIGDDSATLIVPNSHMQATDPTGTTADFIGVNASAYQVTSFASLRAALEDAGLTDLNNTGLPFGPGDFTGAFQWGLVVPFSGTATVTSTIDIVVGAPPAVIGVPALSPAGIGLSLLLLATAGFAILRRRSRA